MARPRLLDLYCGAGGAAMGYYRAGFDVVGVDIKPQPRYPFPFVRGDALRPPVRLDAFDAIHASPPCQAFTSANNRWRGKGSRADGHLDLLAPTRAAMGNQSVPYVIENVPGAGGHMAALVTLTGGMFGLGVHRPRLFESNVLLLAPPKAAAPAGCVGVYGRRCDGRRLNTHTSQRAAASIEEGGAAMGIDWMGWRELCEAIPPAYTEWIGRQLLRALD